MVLNTARGTLSFSDFSVSPTTGAVAFRGVIPNPDRLLLPGMYVNVRLTAGVLNKGVEVPQLSVQRDAQGSYVLTVGADGMVAAKRVNVISSVGANWLIGEGLEDGAQVIVSGLQLARPGMKAVAKPADAAPPVGRWPPPVARRPRMLPHCSSTGRCWPGSSPSSS
jgi:membrane fusion protein (multidrug efflux system)